MNKKELWLNLANYHFAHLVPTHLWDEIAAKFGGQSPFTKAFADKLCRKLGWERNFAMKAIFEYKKFVYLGVISEFSVTPSKVIDQVWHEHLLFSAGYRDFCRRIIQYDFDHNPELVSVDSQTEAFQAQYFHTMELYESEFGCEPPSEIWSATKFKGKIDKIKKLDKHAGESGYSNRYDGTDPLISMFPFPVSDQTDYSRGSADAYGRQDHSGDHGSDGPDSGGDSGGGSDSGSSCSSSCGGGGD